MYKNKVTITFEIFPDKALDINNITKPTVNAAHQFEPTEFGIKDVKGLGPTYSSGAFEFNITMGDSNWDNLNTLSPNLDATIAHEIFHSYQLYVKYKATEQMGILDEMELMEFEDGTSRQFELYDNIAEFIENYEEAREKKKEVKKPKGIEKFLGE